MGLVLSPMLRGPGRGPEENTDGRSRSQAPAPHRHGGSRRHSRDPNARVLTLARLARCRGKEPESAGSQGLCAGVDGRKRRRDAFSKLLGLSEEVCVV